MNPSGFYVDPKNKISDLDKKHKKGHSLNITKLAN